LDVNPRPEVYSSDGLSMPWELTELMMSESPERVRLIWKTVSKLMMELKMVKARKIAQIGPEYNVIRKEKIGC
jgi:hypothetical protein